MFEDCRNANDLKKKYRKLAAVHHPDRGGDPEKFKAVKEAYEVAKKTICVDDKCSVCLGDGKVKIRKGFFSFYVVCMHCRGLGNEN